MWVSWIHGQRDEFLLDMRWTQEMLSEAVFTQAPVPTDISGKVAVACNDFFSK